MCVENDACNRTWIDVHFLNVHRELFYLLNNEQFKEREHIIKEREHIIKEREHIIKERRNGPSEEKMFYSSQIKCPSGEEFLKNGKKSYWLRLKSNTAKHNFLNHYFFLVKYKKNLNVNFIHCKDLFLYWKTRKKHWLSKWFLQWLLTNLRAKGWWHLQENNHMTEDS